MLRKGVPAKMQENKGRKVRDLKEIITYEREEEAGVNLESVIQEENNYFDLHLDVTPVSKRHGDLYEELTKTLDFWERPHIKTFINNDLFPSYREALCETFLSSVTPPPSLCGCRN